MVHEKQQRLLTDPARERLMTQVLRARTLAEIADARDALEQWMKDHPQDTGIVYAFDDLYLSEQITRSEMRGAASAPAEPQPA